MTQGRATTDRPTLVRWRTAMIVAFGLGGVTLSTWGPRLPAITATLGLDTAGIGLLLAGVTVGSVAGLLLATPLLSWLGSRRAIGGVLLLVAVALAVIGLGVDVVRSVPVVGVGFVIAGLGIGAFDVMINVEGSAIERGLGRTLMPLLHAAWSAGAAIGSGIGAACAAIGIDPVGQFVGEAVLMAVVAVPVMRAIPLGSRATSEEHDPSRTVGQRVQSWLRGWTDWRLLMIGLVMLGAELGEGSANNWLTLATKNDHGQSAAVAALFFTAFAIGETTARALGGPLVDRFGRVRTTRATTALGVVGVVLFILGGSPWLVLVGVLLWAVGVSMGFPLGMSAAAESGSNPAARVSVVASIGYFANLAGPPAIGFLAGATGLLGALWLVALLLAVAFVAAGSLRPTRPVADAVPAAG
ncbi:MFS transporter [Curtobacterium sp. RRHDQ10]|uniref:MFS transporter n=1 Tax=Curtobacterium phyllosphaerae TaxID=3413379 RepID=UPI003BF036C9